MIKQTIDPVVTYCMQISIVQFYWGGKFNGKLISVFRGNLP